LEKLHAKKRSTLYLLVYFKMKNKIVVVLTLSKIWM
jgi:hypothetical protein